MEAAAKNEPVIIKKYANRRLYDTETSAYITLEDMYERVKKGRDFMVVDAKSGQDLTRQVLTQIILEKEINGSQLLPTDFLRSVIRFYDDKMQSVLQQYLNASMKTFMNNHERMKSTLGKAMDGFSPLNQLEEMTRQNVAFFEQAMSMFNPLSMFAGKEEEKEAPVKKRAKR